MAYRRRRTRRRFGLSRRRRVSRRLRPLRVGYRM